MAIRYEDVRPEKARGVLSEVEGRLGVKPTVGERLIEAAKEAGAIARGEAEPVETVTKSPEARHEKSADKEHAPVVFVTDGAGVTKSPIGRPKKDHVLTPAERAASARARKKDKGT